MTLGHKVSVAPIGPMMISEPGDWEGILGLLQRMSLPTADLAAGNSSAQFLVARDGREVVGVVGLEQYGPYGLLRSLAVDEAQRSRGWGTLLCEQVEARAYQGGIKTLFLLTTTAERFFLSRGYQVCSRQKVPAEIGKTSEFLEVCPSSAVCLAKNLWHEVHRYGVGLLAPREVARGVRMWGIPMERAKLTFYDVSPSTRFETHSHDGEQITYVLEGELVFEVKGKVYPIRAGEGISIPPGVPHEVWTLERPAKAVDAWSPPFPKS